jgi:hypothetical protein
MTNFFNKKAMLYIIALLRVAHNANCVRLATIINTSHDGLSRVLKRETPPLLLEVVKTLFKTLEKISVGYLIIDDTTINKEYARFIEQCHWLWSSNGSRYIFGYNIVVIMWSNGSITIPLKWEFYKKEAEKKNQITKIEIAKRLMQYVKEDLCVATTEITFDSFYGAETILKRCEEYGWHYYTKVKSNRLLDSVQLKKHHQNPYWEMTGLLSCKLKTRIIRHGKRYFCTNNFAVTKTEIIASYDARWKIEEVFRMLHDQLGIDECASRSFVAQSAHITFGMIAYTILASQKTGSELTVYQRHDRCMIDADYATLLVNSFVNKEVLESA